MHVQANYNVGLCHNLLRLYNYRNGMQDTDMARSLYARIRCTVIMVSLTLIAEETFRAVAHISSNKIL